MDILKVGVFVVGMLLFLTMGVAKASNDKYGITGSFANLSVDDPNGSTDTTSATYLSGVYTMPINRNDPSLRYWFELKYRSFELDSSTSSSTQVGQDVTSLSLSATAQKAWAAQSIGAYWVGLGAELGLDDFENRHTVDSGGFLAQSFPDRSASNLGLIINSGFNLKKTQDGYFIGMNVNYHIPIDDGIDGFSVNAFVLW